MELITLVIINLEKSQRLKSYLMIQNPVVQIASVVGKIMGVKMPIISQTAMAKITVIQALRDQGQTIRTAQSVPKHITRMQVLKLHRDSDC